LVDCSLTLPIIADLLNRGPGRIHREASLFSPGAHLEDYVQRDEDSGTAIVTLADAVLDPGKPISTPPAKFLRRLRRLHEQVIILDLPAGTHPFWLDLFILSDVPIALSGPDPWSVRAAVPFLGEVVRRADELSAETIARSRLRSYLLVNGCRDASERELGEVLCHAFWRKLDHYPRYLGPVDFDERRWFHVRHTDECPPLSSSEGLGVQVEEIAKRILSMQDFDHDRPRTGTGEGARAKARWMGLSEQASSTAMRAQYRRLWEGYKRETAISQVVLSSEERVDLIAELEQTYRALQVALDAPPANDKEDTNTVDDASAPPEHTEAIEEVGHCGAQIRKARQKRELTLKEFSLHTRIGLRYLEAVEAMEVDALPHPVYLRGYLREIARVLDYPIDSLLDRYLTELAERSEASSRSALTGD
jgi:flagellar biosynthesis protein FlhG